MPNIQVGDQVISFPDEMSPDELNQAVKNAYDQTNGPPSLKDKIYDKAKSISPELVNPINMIPGVAPARLGMAALNKAMDKSQEGYDLMGKMAAEGIDQGGKHPYLSSAVGGTIQNIPAGVNAAGAIEAAPGLAKALEGIGGGAGRIFNSGAGKLRNLARILTGPGEVAQNVAMGSVRNAATGFVDEAQNALSASRQIPPELAQAKADLPQLQATMAKLTPEREALVAKAGKNIQALEQPLGPLESNKIADMMSDPAKASERLQRLTRLTAKGSDYVAENMSASDIRINRQFLQEMSRNPEVALQNPQAAQANTVFGEAMDKHIPGYKDALDLYKSAQQALEDVPNVKAGEIGALRSKIKSMGDAFTNSKLESADALKKAQLNAKQIMQKANQMVDQGKLSDVYRQRLVKGIIATGLFGGATHLAKTLGGR